MRLARITTRRLMVLVAIAAIATLVWVQKERARQRFVLYRRTATMHRNLAIAYRGGRLPFEDLVSSEVTLARANRSEVMATYHEALYHKYHRAMSLPWVPIPPDPLPPR